MNKDDNRSGKDNRSRYGNRRRDNNRSNKLFRNKKIIELLTQRVLSRPVKYMVTIGLLIIIFLIGYFLGAQMVDMLLLCICVLLVEIVHDILRNGNHNIR